MKVQSFWVVVLAAWPAGCSHRRCCAPCVVTTSAPAAGAASVAPAKPAEAKPAASTPPEAVPDEEAWMKLGEPGEEHARLKVLVGEWEVHAQMTHAGETMESDGTASFTMLFGDRYLRQEFKGNFQGMPFEGRGIMGYDNASKKWFGVWIDSMSTGTMTSQGEETQKGKTWAFKSSFNGPQGVVTSQEVLTLVSEKEWTYESTMSTGDKMFLRYKRK